MKANDAACFTAQRALGRVVLLRPLSQSYICTFFSNLPLSCCPPARRLSIAILDSRRASHSYSFHSFSLLFRRTTSLADVCQLPKPEAKAETYHQPPCTSRSLETAEGRRLARGLTPMLADDYDTTRSIYSDSAHRLLTKQPVRQRSTLR